MLFRSHLVELVRAAAAVAPDPDPEAAVVLPDEVDEVLGDPDAPPLAAAAHPDVPQGAAVGGDVPLGGVEETHERCRGVGGTPSRRGLEERGVALLGGVGLRLGEDGGDVAGGLPATGIRRGRLAAHRVPVAVEGEDALRSQGVGGADHQRFPDRQVRVTSADLARACLRTLVSASWMIRKSTPS